MTSDPHYSHREDQDQPAEPEPADEPQPKDEPAHGHARPGTCRHAGHARVARAILTRDDPAAHDAAAVRDLPGLHHRRRRLTSASRLTTHASRRADPSIAPAGHARCSPLVQATEAELRAAGN